MKPLIRDVIAAGLHRLQLTDLALQRAGRLYIATFHRVLPEELRRDYPLPGLAVTPDELEWFVRCFQQSFRCQRLDVAWRELSAGEKSARPRLAITFDDGQCDNFLYAAPVLERLGVPATFFVPVEATETQQLLWHDRVGYSLQRLRAHYPDSPLLAEMGLLNDSSTSMLQSGVARAKQWSPLDRLEWIRRAEQQVPDARPSWDGMMSWTQLGELAGRGHEIGSHSYTHPLLVACDDEQLEQEVAISRQRLEQELGIVVTSFCYPNGDHDRRVVRAVEQAGYQVAVTTQWGYNESSSEPFTLRRHDMVATNTRDRRGRLSVPRLAMRMAGYVRGAN